MLKSKQTLVLSGGAALGFAHIGVIKALEEKNISYNQIIGTSFGALVGAFLSVEYNYKQINQIIEELNLLNLVKLNVLELNSLVSQKKIFKFLQEKIGNKTFNETKKDLKIVATNLKTGKLKLFCKKDTPNVKIIDAVCASISIPTIFKPYKIESSEYIDGFLTSNFPIEFSDNKKIIGINLINENIVNLKDKFAPQIFKKSVYIMMNGQLETKLRFIKNNKLKIIDLDLSKYKTYEFLKYKQIIKAGYESFNNLYK